METIIVKTNDDIISLFHRAVTDYNFFEDKRLSFSPEAGKLIIYLKGAKFNSTITTGIMKGVIALQESINNTYSMSVYGERRKLTTEEKKLLELSVKIEEGSSILEIDFQQLVKDMGERIKTMTGKEVLATIGIIAVSTALTLTISKKIDTSAEIERLRLQNAAITDIQKNTNEIVKTALESQAAIFRSISKQDFEELKISGETFTPTEISTIVKTTRERRPITQALYSDIFIITDIHFEEDAIYLDVQSATNGKVIKYVNIFREIISTDDYQWFKDSTNRQSIKMTIATTEKNGEIIASSLRTFEK